MFATHAQKASLRLCHAAQNVMGCSLVCSAGKEVLPVPQEVHHPVLEVAEGPVQVSHLHEHRLNHIFMVVEFGVVNNK